MQKDSPGIQINPEVTQGRTRTPLHYSLGSEGLLGGALALGLRGELGGGTETEDPERRRTVGKWATATIWDLLKVLPSVTSTTRCK